ncbi:MAG: diguanylate cyclase [Gammaproteobacteria bacterium]|nr:diguanylate cyclase [Gammaproteobacteria bacterium]
MAAENKGYLNFLMFSLMALAIGVAIHVYNAYINSQNGSAEFQYQQAFADYQKNNIFYLPVNTINWIEIRQNENGYFVTNPDLINEPSQYNQNSLRSTRYALATLSQLNGTGSIDEQAALDFVKRRYHEFSDDNNVPLAGFSTLENTEIGIRPTMDAILTLKFLGALGKADIDWQAVRRFILKHQNADGGFWDPHYPKFGKTSCIQCSSFALRALGTLNEFESREFSEAFKQQMVDYIKASWDQENKAYSSTLGASANDSYDIFRAFIILWHLENKSIEEKKRFVLSHLPIKQIGQTLKTHFSAEQAFARKWDANFPSMKATHLMVWMYYNLDLLDELDKDKILEYVFINEKNPGEYGGDIYNTYSATGILTKFGVSTSPLVAPKKPRFKESVFPDFAPYLLYVLALSLALMYFNRDKRRLIDKNLLLESKAFKDKLTGLHNRDFFEKAYAYHQESDEIMSLLLIDIDSFKAINDQHGHLVGDITLQEISKLLQTSLRASDTLARWGGEEFALLCPYTDMSSALTLAEKLRTIIANHNFKHVGTITASFGVSTRNEEDNLDSFFERADKALYQSKQTGRNKVSHS